MQHVSLTEPDGVAVLTIDRPPANALDQPLLASIVAAVYQLAADPPRALVLTGRQGFFCAGADLNVVPSYGPADRRKMVEGINAMALGFYGLPCPVIAAVTGHAIAGGLVLALCADLRVASSKGQYGLTEIKVQVPYPQAAIGVVRSALAPHAARTLVLGNQLVDAGECLRLGVFDEIAEPADVLPRATQLAHKLATFSAEDYARAKRDLRSHTLDTLRAAATEDPLLEAPNR